jgi:hypothetical protein
LIRLQVLDQLSLKLEDVSTIGVLEEVTRFANTLRSCQRYIARCPMADLSITSLYTGCSTIRLQLSQIRNQVFRDGGNAPNDRFEPYILEEYQSVLEACSICFVILNRHLGSLGLIKVEEMSKRALLKQLKSLWDRQQMEIISQTIIGLARAIRVLYSAFISYVVQNADYAQ